MELDADLDRFPHYVVGKDVRYGTVRYGTVRYGTVRCGPVPGTGILSPDPDEALQDDVCPVTIRYISINGESLSKR